MAMGKYAKVDARKSSSNYCSTVTIFVFVALCLVGVWMMTSTSVVPVESSENSQHNSNEMPDQKKTNVNKESEEKNSRQYEDNPGDLPDDATKGDSNNKIPREENSSENQEKKSNDSEDESNSETESGENNADDDNGSKKTTNTEGIQKKTEENSNGTDDEYKTESLKEEEKEKPKNTDSQQNSGEKKEVYPSGAHSELLKETNTQKSSWSSQALESSNEKELQHQSDSKEQGVIGWKVCNTTAGQDYIPCLDNLQAVRKLRSTKHYEHRERHCPADPAECLVPLPNGYKNPVEWPKSREKVWYNNVPHTELAQVKGHQNWVKVSGEYLNFPGGGTQFIYGALHYIDFIEKCLPEIAWGKHSRVVLDVGCGVASFGGFLFDKGVITMSLAPKDEHEAQVQFALERGIPAISAVMGTKRLPFPGRVFDVVHCARCRVPWHIEGGKLLLELNRVLRPGGHFVWSATPVYLKEDEDVEIWNAMTELTKSMCWELVSKEKDAVDMVGVAIFRKPISNDCYKKRSVDQPPICQKADDPNAAWYVPLQACLHKVPEDASERGSQWPEQWPARLDAPPYWLLSSQVGVYGKPAPEDFAADCEHWKNVVTKSYLTGIGINWSTIRNVMDMRSIYGGFAAALKDLQIWVMNVVPVDSPDTLPIIYERGLFGIYHDWCESFSTYPRTYDLLHADHIFSQTKKRCDIVNIVVEVDRILRPEGKLIVRDNVEAISEIEKLVKSMNWEVRLTFSNEKEGLLCVQKTRWRPDQVETVAYAI